MTIEEIKKKAKEKNTYCCCCGEHLSKGEEIRYDLNENNLNVVTDPIRRTSWFTKCKDFKACQDSIIEQQREAEEISAREREGELYDEELGN